jgi:hypothetical protein
VRYAIFDVNVNNIVGVNSLLALLFKPDVVLYTLIHTQLGFKKIMSQTQSKATITGASASVSQANTPETDMMREVPHTVSLTFSDGTSRELTLNAECPQTAIQKAYKGYE